MTLPPWVVYAAAAVMVVLALLLLLLRRGHRVSARNVRSSVVAGEVNAPVTITSTESHGADSGGGHGDRVAWVIAIVGVLVAAAQFAHDALGFLK